MNVELYPHQAEALGNMADGKILHGGVGSGKTITALAYYMKQHAPKHLYVITTAGKRDRLEWDKEAAMFGIFTSPEFATPGTGVLTIDSWNSVAKYTDVEDAFFIFDEQRLVGTGAWVKAFHKIAKKNPWVMLSATPGDTWVEYAPVFIANGFFKNITQFKREHVLYEPFNKFPKIKGYLAEDTLERYRNLLLVEMPFARHTKRHLHWLHAGYDEKRLHKAWVERWNEFENEPSKDVGEVYRVVRRILAESTDKHNLVRRLVDQHKKVIIFYNFNYELEILRELFSDIAIGEWNGHKKTAVPEWADEWVYLVQYTSGAEGWNCVATDTMIFFSETYSYKLFEQSQGRIDRLNTEFTDLYYYVISNKSKVAELIRRAVENKEIFNERANYEEF